MSTSIDRNASMGQEIIIKSVLPTPPPGDTKIQDVSLPIISDVNIPTEENIPHGILKASQSRGSKPFYLSFKDWFYQIQTSKTESKRILNNINGVFKSGETTAIMGPSGCGKTSMLNYLTNRIEFPKKSVNSGNIYINSDEITTSIVANYSSYVMQDDVLVDVLTPIETWLFISKLKSNKPEEEHWKDVQEMIEILKIEKCKNTRIGNPQRKGLSGGEKKRVSIGVEIMSNPSILFLDEPTSGWDSTTSGVIIEFWKDLAKIKNMIVAFTIHQPSSNIFQHFNKLMILNKGEMVYQGYASELSGTSETVTGVVPYFDKVLDIPLEWKANPCDSFMHVIEEQNAGFEGTHKIENPKWKDKKPLTELYKEHQQSIISSEIESIISADERCTLPKKSSHNVSYCKEFKEWLKRTWVAYIRNPSVLRLKCIMTFVFCFVTLSIFWRIGNGFQDTHNKAGFLFFFSINNFLSIVFGAILVFPQERGIFLRENQSKIYGVSTYYIAKNIVETPLVLINVMVFSIIVYYLVGWRDDAVGYFFMFLLIFFAVGWFSHSFGYLLGTLFPDLNTATIISQFTVIPFFLFSGCLINVNNMPVWLGWLQYLSPFRYSVEAALKNEFERNTEYTLVNIIEEYSMDFGKWNCVILLFVYGLVCRIAGGFR